jgi:hypothetical protein
MASPYMALPIMPMHVRMRHTTRIGSTSNSVLGVRSNRAMNENEKLKKPENLKKKKKGNYIAAFAGATR